MKKIKRIYDPDRSELSVGAVESFFRVVRGLATSTADIVVSFPGGRSVSDFFSCLRERSELLSREKWERLHIFWTDERLVPPNSDESNYAMADRLLLDHLLSEGLLEESRIHRFPGESTDAGEAVYKYSEKLDRVSEGIIHVPVLGVGPDGHVGSLFPHRPELSNSEKHFLLVNDSPKPPKRRMTISPKVIRESIYPFIFFLGEEKRRAYDCFEEDETTYFDCPCKLAVTGSPGKCYVITNLR